MATERISIDLPLTVPTAVRLMRAVDTCFRRAVIVADDDPQKLVIEVEQETPEN